MRHNRPYSLVLKERRSRVLRDAVVRTVASTGKYRKVDAPITKWPDQNNFRCQVVFIY
jgi:hypothetical protein